MLDKAYCDGKLAQPMRANGNELLTCGKATKGLPQVLEQCDRAANDLADRAVAGLRQPIESFFSWLNEKTHIGNASKVRSEKGLLVHVFGRLAAALLMLQQF